MVGDDSEGTPANPGVDGRYRVLFLWIQLDVIGHGQPHLSNLAAAAVLLEKMKLPVTPLYGLKPRAYVDRKTLPVGRFRLTQEELRLIDTINDSIRGCIQTGQDNQGSEDIRDMNYLVGYAARGDFSWPANDERSA